MTKTKKQKKVLLEHRNKMTISKVTTNVEATSDVSNALDGSVEREKKKKNRIKK